MTGAPSAAATPAGEVALIDQPSTFEGVGGLELLARRWSAAAAPRAAVALVHGFGDHSGRYVDVVATLTSAGFAVHGFDLRGHGRSPGRRGHIAAWSDYRDDVGRYLDHVRAQETPETPVFLYGHSLGGAIVLEYGLRRPGGFSGVVASAPALRPNGVRSPALEGLAAGMSRIWPTFALTVPLEDEAITRDPERLAAVGIDPLCHRRLTVRATVVTLDTLAWTEAHAGEWRPPLLIFHGSADRVIDPTGTVAFAQAAKAGGAPDVELHLYEGGYHEAHNDLDRAAVMADVVDWLDRHVPLLT
jgi:acylglycerol lipase